MVKNAMEQYRAVCVALGEGEGEAEEKVKSMVSCGVEHLNAVVVGGWKRDSLLTSLCFEDRER